RPWGGCSRKPRRTRRAPAGSRPEAAPQTKRAPAASRPSRSIASAKSAAMAEKVPGAPAPGGKPASTSPWTRPGWASAKRRAVPAPIERPPTTAALAPTWSRTRPRSATNASGVYADASAGASLRACPRASKRTIRYRSLSPRAWGRKLRALPPKPCARTTTGPLPSTSTCSRGSALIGATPPRSLGGASGLGSRSSIPKEVHDDQAVRHSPLARDAPALDARGARASVRAGEGELRRRHPEAGVPAPQPERPHPRAAGRRPRPLGVPGDQPLPGAEVRQGPLAEAGRGRGPRLPVEPVVDDRARGAGAHRAP